MSWTRDFPQQPGVYWARTNGKVYVVERDNDGKWYFVGGDESATDSQLATDWTEVYSVPIKPPVESGVERRGEMKAVVVMRFEVESGLQLKTFIDELGAKLPIAGIETVDVHEAYYLKQSGPVEEEQKP